MKIAAVVVTYNRKDFLLRCIEKLQNQTYNNFDIFIIDNNSNDGSGEAITSIIDNRIKYYNTGENLGGAGGFAYGINKVGELGYDYCWVMDDDTMVRVDALSSLISKMQKIDASFICSRVLWKDGKACFMNTPPTACRMCFFDTKAMELGLIHVLGCSFVSCLVNMTYVQKMGLPIREFFIYGDDVEFTRRLETCAKGYLDIDSVVIHEMPNNTPISIINCTSDRIIRYKYGVRNNVYIKRKHDRSSIFKIFTDMLKMAGAIILKSPDKKLQRLAILISSTVSGLFFSPTIRMIGE